jgi:hypothetical protein
MGNLDWPADYQPLSVTDLHDFLQPSVEEVTSNLPNRGIPASTNFES